jgi:hypothetical protein
VVLVCYDIGEERKADSYNFFLSMVIIGYFFGQARSYQEGKEKK